MFEGLVRQLILGYLGQYIKDIQKEQLKITLWNEEVLLENVELILEAFDYLQLPFALKKGHVGKLSIKIPWKKLGWDPIIIILEDVVICACQREDREWSADAIERREFAGKKAKLAAAELAKLSRRVCDNQTGKSFISYITAKILDGIQVSVRNVHVQYRDMLTASVGTVFGLKFSSLTITRQNPSGVSGGKVRGGQVNKVIKVQGLGFYCSTFEGSSELVGADDAMAANHQGIAGCEDNKDTYMLAPFDVSVFLSVNRSGKLENDAPQYSMNIELSRLVISVNEVQLKQILTIYDYLSTCQLREKYGRYRPWWSPLEKKLEGWQTSWWHYAQESVLSDVKKRLRKKSWKYLGVRLKCRRKYVNLYKTKLKCLQQDQAIDEDVLRELEEMEKEYYIDDILSYRSAAEHELQDFLVNSFSSSGGNISNPDESLEDEQASGKGRGWLNWLSRGMLGAGGTDDSSQFSGVISDDVIQDIYEATKFRPVTSLNGDAAATNKIYLSFVKLNTHEISATLRSLKLGCAIACLVLDDISTECKIWEESATFVASVGSAKILNVLDMQAILFTRKDDIILDLAAPTFGLCTSFPVSFDFHRAQSTCVDFEKDVAGVQQPALNIQVGALPPNAEASLSVKVVIQPVEILCDLPFINSIMEFYSILEHVSFQYERILLSLNGMENVTARILSKTEFVLSNSKRMTWDVNFINIVIVIPWGNTNSKPHQLVFEAGELSLLSKGGASSLPSDLQSQSYPESKYVNCSASSDDFLDFQLQDLYDNFEINIGYFEMNISNAYSFGTVPLLERFGASLTLATCVIPDEPMMKTMDVNIRVSSLLAHFSPSVYRAIIGLVTHFNMMHRFPESAALKTVDTHYIKPNGQMTSHAIWFSITSNLESVTFQVDLENDERNTNTMMVCLNMVDIWFDKKEFPECWACTKALRVNLHEGQAECETLVLSSSENLFQSESTEHSNFTFRHGNESGDFADISSFTDGCFLFQYQACRNLGYLSHKHRIWINNIDIHCYPFLVGLLACFFDKIFGHDKPVIGDETPIEDEKSLSLVPGFEHQKFGFSNFSKAGPMERASIPLDTFPFITIHNQGSLPNLESSLIDATSEWRKKVNLQDGKCRSPSFNAEMKLECFDATSKAAYGAELLPQNWSENHMIKVDLSMGSIKVHFHDSSCIIGTVSLPVARSSFSICDDHFDILCSTDGLALSCSWWSQMIHDVLWGPLVPDFSPILNIRVKKEYAGFKKSFLRISFGVQHVSCILPPDFLAVLIGYFSLPEWNFGAIEKPVSGNSEYASSEDEIAFEYKFEILDSNLLIPAYSDGFQFLKLDIQQFYCSFIQSSGKDAAMNGIPTECSVMADKVADRNNCLNLFGRDLSLSLLLLKDDILQPSSLRQVSGWKSFTLIAPFSADVWVRIPFQSETSGVASSYPTCIMATVANCQLNVEGACIIVGSEALVNVINQFSLTGERSTVYTGDVVQFLQMMRGLVENAASSPQVSSVSSIWITSCVRSMKIRLHQSVEDSITSEVIADAEMQFACSASLVNDKPVFLDISFSSLTVFSLLNSVMLADCPTTCSSSSLRVIVSISEAGKNKFHVCLPSLDIWLHRYDWSQVNYVLTSYFGGSSKSSATRQSPNSLTYNHKDPIHDVTVDLSKDSLQSQNLSSRLTPENLQQDSSFYLLQLEELGVKVLVPAQVNGNECEVLNKKNLNDSGISTCGNQLGFVTFAVQTKSSELVIDGKIMRMKINLEKARGTMELYGDTDEASWPLFQLSQILLEGEITNYQMAHIHIKCDTLDVWLSSRALHLWCFMQLKVPEAGPSHTSFGNLDLEVQLRKFTLLFIDGKWSPSGSLLEIVMRNIFLLANTMEGEMEGSIEGDLHVNYNNIDKVLWEPFVEPWQLQLTIARRNGNSVLLNSVIKTNIHLKSRSQLNLNVNESLIEVVSRTIAMIEDAWSVTRSTIPPEVQGFPTYQMTKDINSGRYAPYIVQNLTSLPLVFHVCKGLSSGDLDVDSLSSLEGNHLQPGSSVPIYVDETPEEQLVRHRPSQSSERLSDYHVFQASHRYILIQFEGTATPSGPISMDLVGLRYFEVDFSKSLNLEVDHAKDGVRSSNSVEGDLSSESSGFGVPVVIDVSVEQYTKLIRLYSTVVLCNSTPVPLEVRFDIPFGVSPKILDPVYPGQEFPLPLHLAEAGCMRCRPLGNTYLWSEAYSISNILSHENKISFLRSIVCYPSHPSSDPFRCCILVKSNCLPSVDKRKKGLSLSKSHYNNEFTESSGHIFHDRDTTKQRLIHWVTLSSPLILKNYLPEAVSLILDNGSVARNALLSEVETSFFHIDSSHDLTITLDMRGFKSSSLKFQRAETFCSLAKFDGTKLSLSETITFYPELSGGPVCVTIEKIMDAFSGAREVCISVPFLLCNCTGFPLNVSNSLDEMRGHDVTIPSCYDLDADFSIGRKDGLSLLYSNQDPDAAADTDKQMMASSQGHITKKLNDCKSSNKPLNPFSSSSLLQRNSQNYDPNAYKVPVSTFNSEVTLNSQLNLKSTSFVERDNRKVGACIYSPDANSSPGELMVRVNRHLSSGIMGNVGSCPWSIPFPLVPPTGSVSVLVPQQSLNTGHVVSVSAVAAPFSGRTRIITFQPRYVISNACNKALCYKQKGTDFVFLLNAGQHSNIQWTDTTRDLLVSVRFNEPGWQWSGCFLPEHLGDTQVKIHNYLSGAAIMMRIEVQSADLTIKDEKVVGSPRGNSGTNIILVSIDDTGFMPYRIDNFSKERLRVYQQRCETFETLVNSYTSSQYAWDEPCYPHRLTVEVPGERVIGSYALDDVKDFSPVYLPATLEKPERTLFVSVHSEGSIKVLSIIDSTYHNLSDLKSSSVPQSNYKRNHAQRHEFFDHYTERMAIEIPFIGISLMNSSPEELLFACAKGIAVDLRQSLDQQKFALQISSLQIDNQLHNTPYPVILSFDCDNKGHPLNQIKMIDDPTKISSGVASENSQEPVFSLAVAKWRTKDINVVSFEYISLRVADFHLELEQEIVLSFVDFIRAISSRLQSRVLHHMESTLHPLFPDVKVVSNTSAGAVIQGNKFVNLKGKHQFSGERIINEDQKRDCLLAQVIPIGAPWQQIHLLARQQKKIYIELLDLAPIKLSLSFSSCPWMLRDGVLISGESLIHRGLVTLADIEGAKIHLRQLILSHQLASWESVQEILIRHYTRQFLHEMYKLFGSAGVLGNPMGFARSVGLGIKDFLSVPIQNVFQSPAGLITGVAQGTSSLLSNTVYAISDAATQFSKVAHKGIVTFTFDEQIGAKFEKQQKGTTSHNKGLINGLFEGLTGLLQSPIKGAEKHGLPGVLSGIALGVTGLVARPAASILEVTGKTAQSIRNRSKIHRMGSQPLRVRLPRPLSKDLALKPYSWEEAVGTSVLAEADEGMRLRNEMLVICKRLKLGGKYVIITERLILVVSCSSLVDLGKSSFKGIPAEPEWVIETDVRLDSIIHADNNEEMVHIVGSSSDPLLRQNQNQHKRVGVSRGRLWNNSRTPLPLFHANLEFMCKNDAENFLRVLLSLIEKGKDQGWGCVHLLHQSNLK